MHPRSGVIHATPLHLTHCWEAALAVFAAAYALFVLVLFVVGMVDMVRREKNR